MTEIPMAEPEAYGRGPGRPREVTIAGWIILLDAIVGLIASVVSYIIWESWTAGLGLVMAVIAFFLYPRILKQDPEAWTWTVIFNIIAIFLYLTSWNVAGSALSLISVIYLNLPDVKKHFQ